MPKGVKMTPNPNDNGGTWKMEDWKLTEQSSDGHTVIYEYLPEITIHKRIHAKAWDDLAILMNACQGDCFMTVWKRDTTPNETDLFKKRYKLHVTVASSLIEKDDNA